MVTFPALAPRQLFSWLLVLVGDRPGATRRWAVGKFLAAKVVGQLPNIGEKGVTFSVD